MPSSACQTCARSEEHTSELQSHDNLVCRLLLEKKNEPRRTTRSATSTPPRPKTAPHAERTPWWRTSRDAGRARWLEGYALGKAYFFLKDRAPPKFPLFSLRAVLRI